MAYIGQTPTAVALDGDDLANDIITLAKMASGTDGNIISYDASGNPVAIATGSSGQVLTSGGAGAAPSFAAAGGGKVVQVVNVTSTARVAGTTTIPHDDTIPQNSEGTEMMTLAITPTNASNILRIEAVIFLTSSAVGRYILVALFQDSTANALAVNPATYIVTAAPIGDSSPLSHWMSAGTTSETTFKIRAGTNDSATTAMNGNAGRLYGGVCSSSITITEIAV